VPPGAKSELPALLRDVIRRFVLAVRCDVNRPDDGADLAHKTGARMRLGQVFPKGGHGLSVRLTAAMVALVVGTAAAVGILTYRNVEAVALPRALDRAEMRLRLIAVDLEGSIRGARADVLTQGQTLQALVAANLAGGRHPHNNSSEAQLRQLLAQRFVAELRAKPTYSQYRLIGSADGGREIVRVDRMGEGGTIRIVPDAELQRKGDRDYFKETIGLAAGEVYASPVDFNRDHGVIEEPRVPTLRIASPVLSADGRPFGVLIVNMDLRPALDSIRAAQTPGGAMLVVNELGDYLVHPDRDREFGFESGKRFRLQDDFPGLGEALASEIEPRVVSNRNGDRFGVALVPVQLAEGRRVSIVEAVPYARILAATSAVRDASLIAGVLASLAAIALAVAMARSLARPLVQTTRAIEGFARGEQVAVPTDARGEVGRLARAFARMIAEIEEKTIALRDRAEVQRDIIATALDAFAQMDESGRIVEWNPRAETVFGWSRAEAIGQSLASLIVPPSHRERHQAGLSRFLRTGESTILGTRFETEALRRDGKQFRVEVAVTALPRRNGYLFNGFIRDMTERLKLEEQLRQSQKMEALGQLIGGVSHDFNNLLTIIGGNLELLSARVKDEAQRAWLDRASDATRMGSRLTGRLLAFARQRQLDVTLVDLNEQVRGMKEFLQRTLGGTVDLTTSLAPDLWLTSTDPGEVENAVLNLALNARDAMPAGGKLVIETGNVTLESGSVAGEVVVAPGDYVQLSVSDTGAGMTPEVQTRAFEPFFTTKKNGTGLGLSVVYSFVQQSGGQVTIYSEVGTGTTVNIYLPRSAGSRSVVAPKEVATPVMSVAGELVLVVEDHPAVREVTLERLRDLGYRTLEADSVHAAIGTLESGAKVDLVLSDVVMPGGLSGYDLADWLRSNAPGVRILLTSGFTDALARASDKPESSIDILRKPYSRDQLGQAVRKALSAPAAVPAKAKAQEPQRTPSGSKP
jgi:PAS domain S-box-containing protein